MSDFSSALQISLNNIDGYYMFNRDSNSSWGLYELLIININKSNQTVTGDYIPVSTVENNADYISAVSKGIKISKYFDEINDV